LNAHPLARLARGLLAAAALACADAHAAPPGAATPADLAAVMDALVRRGDDTPQLAIESLEELGGRGDAAAPALQRIVATGIGLIAARNGRLDDALAQVRKLQAARPLPDPLDDAAAHLVRASVEVTAGHSEVSYAEARAALDIYGQACAAGPDMRDDCDWRAWWRTLDVAQLGATDQGNAVASGNYAQAMLDLARRFGDRQREAIALGLVALATEANGDAAGATRLMAQAQRSARADATPWVQVRVATLGGLLHFRRQQPEAVQRDYEAALVIATGAGLKRAAMTLRANLADAYIHQGRPGDAIAAVRAALPVAREHRDLRTERLLRHNGALARFALGQLAAGKAEMAQVMAMYPHDAGLAQRRTALREFGDALGKAGDATAALELFHQEEALSESIFAANKAAAEAQMHARYDQDAQKRRIELLERDNQLKSARLGNQVLVRRLWTIGAAALLLLGVLAVLMILRMRELNRALVRHEALLRAHSERDALTGLANRRQFREVMRVRGAEKAFRGALLMVDVDHFKRINDHWGHAAGDRVLVEVARRLAAATRGNDLVARWGGEEFLVFAPDIAGAELDQLAERVRVAVNREPIALEGGHSLPVTVSLGYAAFPLPGSEAPVSWEQAVNLADLSLYTAKNHGRDCAVGIVRTTAATAQALREVEADIAGARADGRVTLRVSPAPQESAPAAA
jgi:diguanylate cyclase (GGDEF)-like protein